MKGNLRLPVRGAIPVAMLAILLSVPLLAQSNDLIDGDFLSRGTSVFPKIWKPYVPAYLPQPNLSNSPRLTELLREGKLELSLNDFLRLVAENSLALEADRFNYLIAQTDLLRTKSGQAARGLPGAPVPSGLFSGAIGAGVSSNAPLLIGGTGAAAITGFSKSVVIGPRGNFDPTLSTNFSFDRVASPLNTSVVSGVPTVITPSTDLQTLFQQQLPFGTSYGLAFNLQRQSSTQRGLIDNPAFTGFFSASVYQPLLNGFGFALTQRFITFAKNNRKIAAEIFRQQLDDNLSAAASLYWDFVAMTDQVKVAQQSVAASEKLYGDNQRQVEAGALAQLDLVQAESQLAASRRDLVIAQTNLELEEAKIKATISKVFNSDLDKATILPTDELPQADAIQIPPMEVAMASALQNRAVIREGLLQLENERISTKFTHNNLLPVFSVFAQYNGFSLAPGTNPVFRQLAHFLYPEYSAGFSLTFSVFNRAAQADDTRAHLELQQTQTTFAQTQSQVGVAVRSAVRALVQNKAQIEAAHRAVETSQLAFTGQAVRLQNGLATPYAVILAQRDLITAQYAEIEARVTAAKDLVALELAMETFQPNHAIDFDNALRGDVWKGSAQP
ncbi:MAG TPA: TolC family protein [Bryobacteraceae bacterium]|nr:TolC family protein [Bryobacteraceae bacterium]